MYYPGRAPSFVNKDHYLYGEFYYDGFMIPYYNSTRFHKKPGLRPYPECEIRDDGAPYIMDNDNEWIRANYNLINDFVNIGTSIEKILKVTIYKTKAEDDITVEMKVGNKYSILYITEAGVKEAVGYLREISSGIPDECRRYIGEYDSNAIRAYIGLDCSTEGKSDKKLIYIASIRGVELLEEGEPYEPKIDEVYKMSDAEKYLKIIEILTSHGNILDAIVDTLASIAEILETILNNTQLSLEKEAAIKDIVDIIKDEVEALSGDVSEEIVHSTEFRETMTTSINNIISDIDAIGVNDTTVLAKLQEIKTLIENIH